jgi:pimeloyl-ACP methyl ester carboxylesterase
VSELLSFQKFLLVQKTAIASDKANHHIDDQVTAVDVDLVPNFKEFLKDHADYRLVEAKTPGYFAFSTAPFNTEDGFAKLLVDLTPAMQDWDGNQLNKSPKDLESTISSRVTQLGELLVKEKRDLNLPIRQPSQNGQQLKDSIKQIAEDLIAIPKETNPELVIACHGYATEQNNVRRWYKRIYQYVNQASAFQDRDNLVFVGYRWSSEQVSIDLESLLMAIQALPLVPRFVVSGALMLALICLIFITKSISSSLDFFLALLLFLATGLATTLFSLVVLRLIVYFRDNYRASNFAVHDLVEFIRLLDQELYQRGYAGKIKLNFIAHSMGGFVVTNVVRILSNVFSQDAIEKRPDSNIGNVFSLERLVLVSPDIPVLAIAASRANFLASSLRRFNEAYLFSNEGDLALRLASTAANYFSYPARTRESGYRLGNVSVFQNKGYGIVNLEKLKQYCSTDGKIKFNSISKEYTALASLFVSNINKRVPNSVRALAKKQLDTPDNQFTIADLFTYFDCTDYIEREYENPEFQSFLRTNESYKNFIGSFQKLAPNSKAVGVLSQALSMRTGQESRPLNMIDYFWLLIDFLRGRDVHGGYFRAPFSQALIYQLAFLGFRETLGTYHPTNPEQALQSFSQTCCDRCIQVLLSPLHYSSIYVQGDDFQAVKKELIRSIQESNQ